MTTADTPRRGRQILEGLYWYDGGVVRVVVDDPSGSDVYAVEEWFSASKSWGVVKAPLDKVLAAPGCPVPRLDQQQVPLEDRERVEETKPEESAESIADALMGLMKDHSVEEVQQLLRKGGLFALADSDYRNTGTERYHPDSVMASEMVEVVDRRERGARYVWKRLTDDERRAIEVLLQRRSESAHEHFMMVMDD